MNDLGLREIAKGTDSEDFCAISLGKFLSQLDLNMPVTYVSDTHNGR